MTFQLNTSPSVVIKTNRETLALLLAASAVTFALSHVVHTRTVAPQTAPVSSDAEGWAGNLTSLDTSPTATISREPLTSDALVVPKEQLALPTSSLRPLARLRGCAGSSCAVKGMAGVSASHRDTASRVSRHREPSARVASRGESGFAHPMERIGSAIRRPFAYAGEKVSGWFGKLF